MPRILSITVFFLLLYTGLWCLQHTDRASAQCTISLCGAGKGAPGAPAATFAGPGDVSGFGTGFAWYSTARAFSATFAAGTTAIADIVDSATGLATCTMKIAATGFADLTSVVCPTASPTVNVVTWCTITNVAGCSITKIYDQTGNGRHLTNSTLAQMPLLTLNILNGLPVITCNNTGPTVMASAAVTQAQALTVTTVYIRTANPTNVTQIIGPGSVSVMTAGPNNVANQAAINAGSNVSISTGVNADNSWNSLSGMFNNTLSAYNINGADTAGVSAGAGGFSSDTIRLCRSSTGNGVSFDGRVAESGIWALNSNATQRNSMYANQHGSSGYNGGV